MRAFFQSFQLPSIVFVIAFGTLISRFGTAMVMPYVTILLVKTRHLPMYWAGLVLGGSYIAQAFGTSLSSGLYRRINIFLLIKSATLCYALLFLVLGIVTWKFDNPIAMGLSFILCFLFIGACRSLIETIGQTIISQETTAYQKHLAFSLRYTLINIGTSLGPIVALALGILNTNAVFYATSLCVFTYFLLLTYALRSKQFNSLADNNFRLMDSLKLLISDPQLRLFISAAFFYYFAFSQMETLFAYTVYHYTQQLHIFVVMYAINGVTIIFLQMPLVALVKRFDLHRVIACGIFLLIAGLLGVTFSTTHALLYYLSMFVFTMGEIFSLSLEGIYIDALAVPEKKYLYFGVNNFSLLGRVVAPPVSAFCCYAFGLSQGLIVISMISALGIPLILSAKTRSVRIA